MTLRSPLPRLVTLLALTVLTGRVTAQDDRRALPAWWDRAPVRSSAHYRIKTDLPLIEARRYGRHLDGMYEEYARRLAFLPARAPAQLNVFIFARQDEYERTLRSRWSVDARGTGGIFFVNAFGNGLAFWTGGLSSRRIQSVIQHEGFHQFAYSRFGNDLPIWVNEGLAEFFGESILVGDRLVLGQATPRVVQSVQQAIETDRSISFREMLSMSGDAWMRRVRDGHASILYDQSWSMVHFLVYANDKTYQPHFERYLRLVNNGTPSEPAFVEVFGADLDAFEKAWKTYALAARPSAFLTAIERIEFLAAGALALSERVLVDDVPTVTSLEDLQTALVDIGFTWDLARHGRGVVLEADDAAMYRIPVDDPDAERARFTVEAPNTGRMTRRQRELEQQQPTPPEIGTENLEPRGLEVEWIRDRKTGELRYEVRTKPLGK